MLRLDMHSTPDLVSIRIFDTLGLHCYIGEKQNYIIGLDIEKSINNPNVQDYSNKREFFLIFFLRIL